MGEIEDGQAAPEKPGSDKPAKAGPTKHYHGHRERLRQRIMQGDGSSLQEYELLELLLCAFIPRRDVKPIAKEMQKKFGSVSAALGAEPRRLMEIDGIGEAARAAMGDSAGQISEAVSESIPLAMFAFFEHFPFVAFVQGLAVVVVAIFFATSSDSASLVIDMLCTGEEKAGPVPQRVFWGVSEGLVAIMLIVLAGDSGITALQQVITVVGLPIFILVSLMVPSIIAGLRHEEIDHIPLGKRPTTEDFGS